MTSINDMLLMDKREFDHVAPSWVSRAVDLYDDKTMDSVINRLPARLATAVRRDIANAWRKYSRAVANCRIKNVHQARTVRDAKLFHAVLGALRTVWDTQAPAAVAPAEAS